MNIGDWITFEQSPWEIAVQNMQKGDSITAMRLLTLLEGEEEDVVEEVFQTLLQQQITLKITGLPKNYGTGELEKRLRFEEKLKTPNALLNNLPAGDPLRLYLEEMAAIPAFGDITILEEELHGNGDRKSAAQNQLMNLSLHRVVELAGEFAGYGVLLLDLIQEGSLGLWKGILAYAPGEDFSAERDWWIHQHMAWTVVQQARAAGIGQKVQTALEGYRVADKRLLTELGRNPTVEELALELHIGVEEAEIYRDMLRTAVALQRAKQPVPEAQPEDEQAVENTALFQSRQRILDMLSTLTSQQAQILTLRFGLEDGLPCTPQETGAKLGLTAEEVVELENMALRTLRNQENQEK